MQRYRGGREGPRWTVSLVVPLVVGMYLLGNHANLFAIGIGILMVGGSAALFGVFTRSTRTSRR